MGNFERFSQTSNDDGRFNAGRILMQEVVAKRVSADEHRIDPSFRDSPQWLRMIGRQGHDGSIEASPEEIEQAKRITRSKQSNLIPKDDQETLKSLRDGILEGDASKIADTLAALAGDRQKTALILDELNKQLAPSGTRMVETDGSVTLYQRPGHTLQNDEGVLKRTAQSDAAVRFTSDGFFVVLDAGRGGKRLSDAEIWNAMGEIKNKTVGAIVDEHNYPGSGKNNALSRQYLTFD